MSLKLDITHDTEKFLDKLPPKQFRQVVKALLKLTSNPEPHDSDELKGHAPWRRQDIGEYRIVYYVIDDDVLRVPLIGKRNDDEVYKKLKRLNS